MKTLKLSMITIFLFTTMISVAQTNRSENGFPMRMNVLETLQYNSLVRAIQGQVSISILDNEHPGLFTAQVRVGRMVIEVYGKYAEWKQFFFYRPEKRETIYKIPW